MKKDTILILGGDKRQEYVYRALKKNGYDCELENQSTENIYKKISECRYIVLPVPASKDKKYIYCKNEKFKLSFDSFGEMLGDGHIVFGGCIYKELTNLSERKEIVFFDFNNNENFLIYNAFLTAQGALRLLLENTDSYLGGRKALITGFGRIGTSLANLLRNQNIDVTVCLRNEGQHNLAECMGFNTINYNFLRNLLTESDYIFNTVPVQIFSADSIKAMKHGSIYFELASAPFGADYTFFDNSGVKFIDGGSLPGKYTPRSAGEKIAEIIENYIQRSDYNGKT